VRDRTKVVSGAGVAGGVLAFLAFVLRMVARLPYYGGKFGLDDWVMVLTMVRMTSEKILRRGGTLMNLVDVGDTTYGPFCGPYVYPGVVA